jgi:hypothetical protein
MKHSSSMLDHWSVHVGNGTISTGFSSLPPGESMTVPSLDQAESIEVLAVFPDSPMDGIADPVDEASPSSVATTLNSDQSFPTESSDTTHCNSHTTNSHGVSDFNTEKDLDDEAASSGEYDDETYDDCDDDDGQEDQDLVSVSLMESENVDPTPRPSRSSKADTPNDAIRQTARNDGVHHHQTVRESVFFS